MDSRFCKGSPNLPTTVQGMLHRCCLDVVAVAWHVQPTRQGIQMRQARGKARSKRSAPWGLVLKRLDMMTGPRYLPILTLEGRGSGLLGCSSLPENATVARLNARLSLKAARPHQTPGGHLSGGGPAHPTLMPKGSMPNDCGKRDARLARW